MLNLIAAAASGDLDEVRRCVEAGSDVMCRDRKRYTPLIHAAIHGHCDVARLLLDRGAQVDAWGTCLKTALMHSIHAFKPDSPKKSDLEEMAALLIDRGASIESENGARFTPLMLAAQSGATRIATLLIDRGAEIDRRDAMSRTALLHAASRGHPDMVRLLVEGGADIDIVDSDGWTALMYACDPPGNARHPDTVPLLLDLGARHDIENASKSNAMTQCAIVGNIEDAKALLDRGADINAITSDGQFALAWAALKGHTEFCSFAIDRGARIEQRDANGWSALSYASSSGHAEVVRLLLRHPGGRAAATLEDENLHRPIHYAIDRKRAAVMAVFFEFGENPFGSMPAGGSYDAACKGSPECLAVLQSFRNRSLIGRIVDGVDGVGGSKTRAPTRSRKAHA
jgi:ankyrin repeat protein